jgi:hypothetical protein
MRLPCPSDHFVHATLRYTEKDPLAVTLEIHRDNGQTVPWNFSRNLLIDGLFCPTGLSDVEVFPWSRRFLGLTIGTPQGHETFGMPRSAVVRFMRRTLALVPRSREEEIVDRMINVAIPELLAPRG